MEVPWTQILDPLNSWNIQHDSVLPNSQAELRCTSQRGLLSSHCSSSILPRLGCALDGLILHTPNWCNLSSFPQYLFHSSARFLPPHWHIGYHHRPLTLSAKADINIAKRKSFSHVWLFATPWTIQSMGFSRPEYWSGFPSIPFLQGIFPIQGLNPGLPHCRRILYQLSHQGSPDTNIRSGPFWTP